MNIKTLKVLKKYANMMIPGSKPYQKIMINLFESMSERDKEKTLKEIKMFILMHSN
jgi:hypothetical protein